MATKRQAKAHIGGLIKLGSPLRWKNDPKNSMTDVICLLLDILDDGYYVDYAAYQTRGAGSVYDVNGDDAHQMTQVVLDGEVRIIDLYLPTVELL